MSDDFVRCGIGIRGVAMAIDAVAWFVLLFVATYLVAVPTGQVETTATGVDAELDGVAGQAAFLLWLGLSIGYHVVLEWRAGQTVGKYLVDVHATSGDGSPLTLRASLVRNVLRLVDVLPLFYVVGIVSIALSDRNERLGDRLGDAAVVRR